MTCAEFVLAATGLTPVPFVEEISLYLAADIYEVWRGTEQQAGQTELAPPFWAFAWPGGQALARYVLDHPALVSGRSVLDVGCGSGLVAIAAAKAGAASVTASDSDPFARTAVRLNASANQVKVSVAPDVLDRTHEAEVVLAGDVWYEQELSSQVMSFLDRAAASGAQVVAGDIGRRYFPRHRFHPAASYEVPASLALESAEMMHASVWIRRLDDETAGGNR
ncbi:MAG TPA: 50S ribosomal protein L11 methyltransferase [Streptosporangiaceae bacterium]|nr:50S ribosomal protein L11 methyltransferase [Streptosporangiaceae bacterium]